MLMQSGSISLVMRGAFGLRALNRIARTYRKLEKWATSSVERRGVRFDWHMNWCAECVIEKKWCLPWQLLQEHAADHHRRPFRACVLIQFAPWISVWVRVRYVKESRTAWLIKHLWNVRSNTQIGAGAHAMLNSASLHKGLLIWCQTHSQTAGLGRGEIHWHAFALSHSRHTNISSDTSSFEVYWRIIAIHIHEKPHNLTHARQRQE